MLCMHTKAFFDVLSLRAVILGAISTFGLQNLIDGQNYTIP